MEAAAEGYGQGEHGSQFADGEGGDEGEGIHPAEIGLAVGNIHSAPHEAGSDGGDNAPDGMMASGAGRSAHAAEAEHDGGGDDGYRSEENAAMTLPLAP